MLLVKNGILCNSYTLLIKFQIYKLHSAWFSEVVQHKLDINTCSLEDTSVRNILVKAVCLTSTSLAVHSNVIKKKYKSFMNCKI